MRLLPLALLLPLLACGPKPDDSAGPTASCDDYVTEPMPSLTPDQYPDGLAEGLEALRNLPGLWRGSHCLEDTYGGRDIDIKIEDSDFPVIPDEVLVVSTAPDESVVCGCGADTTFAADNHLDIVGFVPEFTLFFDPEDVAPIDSSVNQREFLVSGALYAGEQGLFFRACKTEQVEPYLNSVYDTVAVNLRIQTKAEATPLSHLGQVTLTMDLIQQEQGSTPLTCEIVDFVKIPF